MRFRVTAHAGVRRPTRCCLRPAPKAGSLGLSCRHFLLRCDDVRVGVFHPVERPVRHPVQLLRREMHVLMQVLVLRAARPRCFMSNSSASSLSAARPGSRRDRPNTRYRSDVVSVSSHDSAARLPYSPRLGLNREDWARTPAECETVRNDNDPGPRPRGNHSSHRVVEPRRLHLRST